MPILEAATPAAQSEMTTCIRCPTVIPAGPPSIQHIPGWACSQRCSAEADEEELALKQQQQAAVGALFYPESGQYHLH